MTNRRKPSARPKKMHANGAPLKVAYRAISTVVRRRTQASTDVPFDREDGTMSACYSAVWYVAFRGLMRSSS